MAGEDGGMRSDFSWRPPVAARGKLRRFGGFSGVPSLARIGLTLLPVLC